ncbi:glycosyltransferase family 1 protein [Subtercola sp. RTI3]|uniref:glycosyltransferase family 4 protein n=1 Tax=Subtercola sp. RTI3 TaxID=3048639 RepID=UPI002B226206|nr:glycosyltransferase family 1 protein [Subtercola sp. RTI3]MEA9985956.1 glycosyltransferase family 1 protein [Subtercola sp. RTI3]
MKILFDGFWWVTGPVSNQLVLHEIVRGWIDLFPEDKLFLSIPRDQADSARSALGSAVTVLPARLRPQGLSAIFEIPILARRVKADISITHNFSPLWGHSAIFLHDVLFQTNPEWFTRKERAYFSLMPLTAPRAAHIFTSSRNEARRIAEMNGRARTPVAIGLAIGGALLHTEPENLPGSNLKSNSFFLTVGRLNARKNLETTCLAAIRSGRISPEHPLVIAGSFQGKKTQISAEMKTAIADGWIRLLGYVSAGELVWLYSNASSFLFMSLDEGFGLPPLEAMAFGSPVVASDIPVMREILGSHARFVDPTAPDALAEALKNLEPHEDEDQRSSRMSYARTHYNWNATVTRMREHIGTNQLPKSRGVKHDG